MSEPIAENAWVEVREAGARGRGVFAKVDLAEGTLLEECPVIVLPAAQIAALEQTDLADYYFRWGGQGDDAAIALGFASLYNHADEPNAMYVRKLEARTLAFYAVRKISAGEEIRVSYNGGFGDRTPVWFEQALSSGTSAPQPSCSPTGSGGVHARCSSASCCPDRSRRSPGVVRVVSRLRERRRHHATSRPERRRRWRRWLGPAPR